MTQRKQTFSAAQVCGFVGSHQGHWSPDLKEAPTKNEIFCRLDDAAGAGFALALAARHGSGKPWLWVQDKQCRRRGGIPYIHGLPENIRHNLHYVAAQNSEDALFAMEEGLRCAGLSFVIGELSGDPNALGFTASRRLAVASEAHNVTLYLLRCDASRQLSAARMRWGITVLPSQQHRWDSKAPGASQCEAELFRARRYRPGHWRFTHDSGKLSITDPQSSPANRIDLVAPAGHQSLAATGRA